MRDDSSSYQVNLDVSLGREPLPSVESTGRADAVFRLAICGDFSGQFASTSPRPNAPAIWRVDRDDFDDVLASIAPTLRLELDGGVTAEVRIRELDDFLPDQLFDRVPQFARLRELRSRLVDPGTFRRAASELSAPPPAPVRPISRPSGSLLDAIVGEDAPTTPTGAATSDLYEFIQHAMAPHLVARPDPHQAELVAQVDASVGAVMRALLHHPSFQSLEALWRGVFRLVRHVDTNERLQIHLIDLSRESMIADLLGAATARNTTLYQRLNAHASPEQGGWSVLVAHHAFGGSESDIAALERLADVGAALDAPWLSEAHPDLALGSVAETAVASWQRLRASPAARYLGLSLPRIMLRLPYGTGGEEVERFPFEELESSQAHGSYLWGNPALFCAMLLAQGFTERGKGLAAGTSTLVEGLPLHMVRRERALTFKPCAEVVMGEADAIALLDAGMTPMMAYEDQDSVRVPRVQSIGEPNAPLAGRMAR